MGGMGMGGLQGANLGNAGRGGSQGTQINRQTERRAQYSTRINFQANAPVSAAAGGSMSDAASIGSSTLQIRTAVERSMASIAPAGTTVTMDGSVAILSGKVASDNQRKLAERMALLVPGVQSVRNELVLQQ
jgi:osmotically-inducible protein OsmY